MELKDGETLRLVLPTRLTAAAISSLRRALGDTTGHQPVVLEGRDEVFCEGGALPPEEAGADPGGFGALLAAIESAPRPIVALVDGTALGAGVALAAAADLVLASPRARFGLPETLLGLIPAMVFPVLARRIGAPRARLLALGRAALSALEAEGWGLVDEVADDLEAALKRHRRRFARMGAQAIATLKELVAEHYGPPPGYTQRAVSRFADLAAGAEARTRIERSVAGETPWPDDEER